MLYDTIKKEDSDLVFIQTNCATREEARSMAYGALIEKLAVCTDYWPIESFYPWQGVIEDVQQYMLVFTTKKGTLDALVAFIHNVHSYEIPMIAQVPISMRNQAYDTWALNEFSYNGSYLSYEEKQKKDEFTAEDGFHPQKLK